MSTKLLESLNRFETYIETELRDPSADIKSVLVANPKLVYYLSGLSTSMSYNSGPKLAYRVQYRNKDVSKSDIYVVSSNMEVHSLLCQYIGNYKKQVVIFAKAGVDVEAEYHRFMVVNAAFYSNFVGAKISKAQSSLSPMPFYDFLFDYRIGKVKLQMMKNETEAEITRISRQMFLPGMSAETKAFLAHNYLASTIEYTLIENASSLEKSYMQSAYGALIKKKCVCQGYAEAFKQLMDIAVVPCDIVCGQTKGSDTYHAWNIIKLNGAMDNYHIDVTWDSTGTKVSHKYFGLKDLDFQGERTWNTEYNVKCNTNKNLLIEARRGIMKYKSQLIKNGVNMSCLGF